MLYFKLFPNCIPVKGANRSLICDLQKNRYKIIPNILYDILLELQSKTIDEIKHSYDYDEGIDLYINSLIENDWGITTDIPECFPPLSMEWDSPALLNECIIDMRGRPTYDLINICRQLDVIKCDALQIRNFDYIDFDFFLDFAKQITNSNFFYIEILTPYNSTINDKDLENLFTINPRIKLIVFHSAPSDLHKKHYDSDNAFFIGSAIYRREIIDSHAHCGKVDEKFFVANIPSFTEAKNFNSCLNRKISVDEFGEIKNCPSFGKSYGNVQTTSLQTVLNNQLFKKIWDINKDQIEVCKDCEYRYICTDCRAFLNDSQNIFSKPFKCNYDPYQSIWN